MQHVTETFNPEANITVKLIDNNTILAQDDKIEYCFLEMQEDGTIDEEFHIRDTSKQELNNDNDMDFELEP